MLLKAVTGGRTPCVLDPLLVPMGMDKFWSGKENLTDDKSMPTDPVEVEFSSGSMGIGFEGAMITKTIPGGQAEKGGVKVGMRIDEINGVPISPRCVGTKFRELKEQQHPITVKFAPPL